ncbi:MAG TPA: EscU/YscU/HrcU family type III secretion system export apparatus switch protein [Candidatus Limnocylindria bacterium]|nr:EscU/YscU/HrcU family type III secretion system export apparatus switch protein [Candidatus Limnocylindria bacterium]
MSEQAERRFDPTPTRKERALREGNVARSAELSGVAAFGAALLGAFAAAPLVAGSAAAALRASAAHQLAAAPTFALLGIAEGALLPAVGAACAGVALGIAQAGGFRLTAIRFDLKRLAPSAGLKRMVGGEAVVGVARASLAFAAALGAMIPLGWDVLGAAASLASPVAAAALVGRAALDACGAALAVGAVFALADYALARRRWLHGLRMSFDEIKRDAKENDGDPQAKARRKSLHRALVRGAIARTREATFVVVNPTHVAVALRYAPPTIPVPEIVVRALDEAALRVKAIAREHAIPVVEDVALARLLYAQGESGRAIPPETYVAVAQVIASLARAGLA